MSKNDNDIKFLHKTENGKYQVWVYMEDWNQPITLFSGSCDAMKEKKRDKLYQQALAVYQKETKEKVEWESAA